MEIKPNLRILLAGCGSIGKRHASVLVRLGCTNLAAADPSDTALAQIRSLVPGIKTYPDYTQALADFQPEAVFILTPTALHVAMALEALSAGAHVFIEKPLSDSLDKLNELKSLAISRNLAVMVGFCFRYHEALVYCKQLMDKQTIGRLVSIRALMGEPFFEIHPNYMDLYYSRYSGAFELVHDLDLAIWYADQPVKQVLGVYGSYSDMGMQSPDVVEMLLTFEDRCVASVHLDFFQSPRRRQLELMGTQGTILVEFASWDQARASVYTRNTRQWEHQDFTTQRDDMFMRMDKEFLMHLSQGTPLSGSVEEAEKSLRAVYAIYEGGKTQT